MHADAATAGALLDWHQYGHSGETYTHTHTITARVNGPGEKHTRNKQHSGVEEQVAARTRNGRRADDRTARIRDAQNADSATAYTRTH